MGKWAVLAICLDGSKLGSKSTDPGSNSSILRCSDDWSSIYFDLTEDSAILTLGCWCPAKIEKKLIVFIE